MKRNSRRSQGRPALADLVGPDVREAVERDVRGEQLEERAEGLEGEHAAGLPEVRGQRDLAPFSEGVVCEGGPE